MQPPLFNILTAYIRTAAACVLGRKTEDHRRYLSWWGSLASLLADLPPFSLFLPYLRPLPGDSPCPPGIPYSIFACIGVRGEEEGRKPERARGIMLCREKPDLGGDNIMIVVEARVQKLGMHRRAVLWEEANRVIICSKSIRIFQLFPATNISVVFYRVIAECLNFANVTCVP